MTRVALTSKVPAVADRGPSRQRGSPRFATSSHPAKPRCREFPRIYHIRPRAGLKAAANSVGKSGMDDQEKQLERKLERALDALVWGRQQPDFRNDDRIKLLSDVTDARIELWEYQRSQKTTAT